ncbi:MAG TPA: RNase A-like domain-containing protein [Jatrophihabitans sp.]|nr:RNase A-like domain-containing protein [Jatrophihabitans sp.]
MVDPSSSVAIAHTGPIADSCLIGQLGPNAPSPPIKQSRPHPIEQSHPMPVADAETVRLMAARMAELAGELCRVQAAVQGSMGPAAGWSGSAELAFESGMTAQLGRLVPVMRRYDEYAAALAGYARDLDYLQPRLQAARSRLGMPGDPSASSEYVRWWREWDAARGRCVARLKAGLGSGTPHHGWWSGLADGVCRLAHRSVSLAGLSRALSDLGQGLMVAGLVCALVCPPVAGAVWAALAVVAVCQLAVDAARRSRGEPVGWDSLGWDVAAVVPAGRAVRRVRIAVDEVAEYRTAAEADAAIKRLPARLRSSPLVPGGGLKAHEGEATFRGHTILKHVKRTREELAERHLSDPNLQWSSSFPDRATAEAAIARVLDLNRLKITKWKDGSPGALILDADVGWQVGISVAPSGMMVTTAKLRVVLRREPSVLGYYIRTAFPTP